jgi:hypothetical protein
MEITEQERAIEALRALPEHATMEDAIERLCFIAKIEEGLRQSDARQLVSHDEVGGFRGSMQHEPRMEVSWCADVARA